MADINSKLNSFDNKKLIDIVKNYKQYGYDEELRNIAIDILDKRGIGKEQLELSGNFENSTYKSAEEAFNSFKRNSKIAFILYIVLLISNIFVSVFARNYEILTSIILIVNWISLIMYFIFIIKSIINQNDFYKVTGKEYGAGAALIYLFIGMPFYIFAYFYFRNQMNEDMKTIT